MPDPNLAQKPTVSHLSYSACRAFHTSLAVFEKTYINHEKFVTPLVMAVGSAWHAGVEELYRNGGKTPYIDLALKYLLDEKDNLKEAQETDEEKLEEFEQNFKKAYLKLEQHLRAYPTVEKLWEPGEHIEKKVKMASPVEGGYPIVGRMDMVSKANEPVDHKYVGRYGASSPWDYYIQAWFYYPMVNHLTGEYPKRAIFSEYKHSVNRDGSPQLQEIVIEYKKEWMDKVSRWYYETSQNIRNQAYYPANPFKAYDNDSWKEYLFDK
jgi:hypothetical protein